jgi:hypothetical protein
MRKRFHDVIGNAVRVMESATGQREEEWALSAFSKKGSGGNPQAAVAVAKVHRKSRVSRAMSALGGKADIPHPNSNVR